VKPEAKAKKKIAALERKRALIDALIDFVKTHPLSVDGSMLHPLAGRTGLRYDFAVIRPIWHGDKVVLRLERWLENWFDLHPDDAEGWGIPPNMIVREDVSTVSDEELEELLDDVHYELIPEDYEEDGD